MMEPVTTVVEFQEYVVIEVLHPKMHWNKKAVKKETELCVRRRGI